MAQIMAENLNLRYFYEEKMFQHPLVFKTYYKFMIQLKIWPNAHEMNEQYSTYAECFVLF